MAAKTAFRWDATMETSPGAPQRGIWADTEYGPSTSLWATSPILAAQADPQNFVLFEQQFVGGAQSWSETADLATWNATYVDGGGDDLETNTGLDDHRGGGWKMLTNNADNDVNNYQVNGEAFKLAAGKPLWYECAFMVDDISLCDLFVGLSDTNATILGTQTNVLGFNIVDGTDSEVLFFTGDKATAEDTNTTGNSVVDDTIIQCGFYCNGDTLAQPYINGVQLANTVDIATANIPIVAMTPSFEIRNGSAAVRFMTALWVRCLQVR